MPAASVPRPARAGRPPPAPPAPGRRSAGSAPTSASRREAADATSLPAARTGTPRSRRSQASAASCGSRSRAATRPASVEGSLATAARHAPGGRGPASVAPAGAGASNRASRLLRGTGILTVEQPATLSPGPRIIEAGSSSRRLVSHSPLAGVPCTFPGERRGQGPTTTFPTGLRWGRGTAQPIAQSRRGQGRMQGDRRIQWPFRRAISPAWAARGRPRGRSPPRPAPRPAPSGPIADCPCGGESLRSSHARHDVADGATGTLRNQKYPRRRPSRAQRRAGGRRWSPSASGCCRQGSRSWGSRMWRNPATAPTARTSHTRAFQRRILSPGRKRRGSSPTAPSRPATTIVASAVCSPMTAKDGSPPAGVEIGKPPQPEPGRRGHGQRHDRGDSRRPALTNVAQVPRRSEPHDQPVQIAWLEVGQPEIEHACDADGQRARQRSNQELDTAPPVRDRARDVGGEENHDESGGETDEHRQGPRVRPECRVQEAAKERGHQHELRDAARRPPEVAGRRRPLLE